MTDRKTTYDSTTSREPLPGERSSPPGGFAAGTGGAGGNREQDDASERERARRAAEEIKTAAKEAAVSTAGAVRNRLSGELDYRKYRSRQRLERVATVLRQTSADVAAEDDVIARYIERAADRTQRAAEYLDQKGIEEIARDAREMARRRPELFVGSLFIAGLALGRFLRSSAANGANGEDREGLRYSGGSYSGTGVYSGSRPYTGSGASAGAAPPSSTPSTSTPPYKPEGGLVP